MLSKSVRGILAGLFCLVFALSAGAAEIDCDEICCFAPGDFAEEDLQGICLTQLPDAGAGTLVLGTRVLRPGDILTADQLSAMTFLPQRTEQDLTVQVGYLPVFSGEVGPMDTLTISIRGKENQAPIAEDFAAETYKNLPLEGKLKIREPEGETMTFALVRGPKRGQVELRPDGTFLYTPKKNKVGIDSFVYTATDAAGKVSRESTVTVTIVKPTDSTQYTDTVGRDCRFAAEWMKNTGIFVGETLDGNACFHPDKPVTQGEFLTMLLRTLEIPAQDIQTLSGFEDVPKWLKPYVAAAVRAGLISGLPGEEPFRHDAPVTGEEAAVMIQNALELVAVEETAALEPGTGESGKALQILAGYGISLTGDVLTRADTAQTLYRVSRLAGDAPGLVVIAARK